MRPMRGILAVLCLLAVPASAADMAGPQMDVVSHLPKDPLLVWIVDDDSMAAAFDSMMQTMERFAAEEDQKELAEALDEVNAKLGVHLRDDLLARIGPEIAFVLDLPPIDSLMGLAMNPTPEMIDDAFRGVGIVAQVRDPEALDQALKTALTSLDLSPVALEGGGWKVPLPQDLVAEGEDAPEPAPQPAFYWRITDTWLAIGAGPSWLASASRPLAEEARLTAGADFRKVTSHLDHNTFSLFYLNLPKVAKMLSESAMVQGGLSSEPEAQKMVSWVLDEKLTMGWGQTAVKVDGGVRTTNFGPEILSGFFSSGVLAALFVPNFLEALDKARVKRTRADLEAVGDLLLSHATEDDGFPASEGWVDLAEVELGSDVPTEDGWENPLRYWSDGERYVIVSAGKNGEIDRDWSQPMDEEGNGAEAAVAETDDVVYADGVFLTDM